LNKKVNLFQRHGKGGEKQPLFNPTEQPPKLNVDPLVNDTKAKKKTPTPTHKDKKKRSGPHGLLLLKKLKLTTINLQINLFTLTLKQLFLFLMVCVFLLTMQRYDNYIYLQAKQAKKQK
jgi:hypothetical protein